MGLTNEAVIMVSDVTARYVEIVGMSDACASPIAFAFGVGCGLRPAAKRESQPIGLILLHSQDLSEPRIPDRSCDRMLVEVMTISVSANTPPPNPQIVSSSDTIWGRGALLPPNVVLAFRTDLRGPQKSTGCFRGLRNGFRAFTVARSKRLPFPGVGDRMAL